MKRIHFGYQESLISDLELTAFARELAPEIKRVQHARSLRYETPYASLHLVEDVHQLAQAQQIINEKKALNPAALVLVGIGGSAMGTLAIHEAIHGRLYNEKNKGPALYCADTVDVEQCADQLAIVENLLKQGLPVLINVVSKSGKTTETIANTELFLALLKKYRPRDYQQFIIVTTDHGSAFADYARRNEFSVATIPTQVGGRYSVFSAVGLIPLGLLGIDIQALVQGAQSIMDSCLSSTLSENPAAIRAVLSYAHYQQSVNIHDLFLFAPALAGVGAWYRQLMGESIGKEFNSSNQRVEIGITPTVSLGTADLHSVGQLYLAGPRDKFTTFINIERRRATVTLPTMPEFEKFVPHIQGKPVTHIMDAILSGVLTAYRTNKRPYCTITLPECNEAALGQLLQLFMIEMMYLGYLFDINPFDQPHVELYKQETRKILAHE